MPLLPRAHLFEFNDRDWVPASLRDTIVETLSRSLDWGGFLRPLVPVMEDFLSAAGTREVLDLCAGAAGPALILTDEAERIGIRAPRFLITDLFPRVPIWTHARAQHPESIDFIAEPVDATRIPASLSDGRARVIVNAFHHFPPEVAGAILRDAVESQASIFIAESFERDPRGAFPLVPIGIPSLLATPLLSPRDRLAKIAWTWLTPIALAAGTWDALISTLRIYSQPDLLEMVSPFGQGYEWTYGTYDYPFGGRGCYFQGIPAKPRTKAPTQATARRTMDEEQTNPEAAVQARNGAEALPTAPEVNAKRQEATVELQHEVESLEQTSAASEDPLAASTMKTKALRRYLRERHSNDYFVRRA